MRILVATDAWHPQVNGVVRTYERLANEAPGLGAEISFLAPSQYRTLPCPTYPEIRLALADARAWSPSYRRGAMPTSSTSRPKGRLAAGAAVLPQTEVPLHHQLSHAFSRICLGAAAGSRVLVLRLSETVSQ